MSNVHVPVLLRTIQGVLAEQFGKEELTVFDGTLGGGGYSAAFLEAGHEVYGSDLDAAVVETLNRQFKVQKFEALQGNFSEIIGRFENGFFDVIVADLGYSSNQLESSRRGFSYLQPEEALDLRYDSNRGEAAYWLINRLSESELAGVLYRNAGESLANRVARELKRQPVETVAEVVVAVERAIPAKFFKKRNAILSRVWQALRIEVNAEFEHLQKFLEISLEKLKPGGLLMIVNFHSLEDKLVTKFMRAQARPISEDMYGNRTYAYEFLTKKGLLPSVEEVERNVRARSATLRVLKKL